MGGVEDNHWVDLMIDKIGFALTKVDESIQKSIELWKELTKDIYDEQPTLDTTGQPNNVKSGEEDSSQDKSVDEVKERPIQHWAMRLGEAKESPSQHWDMCASKISESLIQEQGDDEVDEKEKEDDEGTVSESSGEEDMCELTLGNSASRYRPNLHHHHNEEASTGYGYGQLNDDDYKSWSDDYESLYKFYLMRAPLGSSYVPPGLPLHKENNALYFKRGNPYHMSINDDTSSKKDDESCEEEEEEEAKLETSETSYIPSGYHHRDEEDTDSRIRCEQLKRASSRARDGYELLKNDDTSSENEEDPWNEDDVNEYWRLKYRIMSDATNLSLVDGDDDDDDDVYIDDIYIDDDDLSDQLQGFVDVKEEEIENKTECDWVFVTRD
ncbi:hypothetical protein HID58_059205 [Brassica napus]|uniref:BnaCnng05040D protein n=2 Tax=Brassica napus TaxID=3708 RepID=A0A078GRW1_BRANA|nr:uncharacterized protein LOC111205050 [Brassica napus]KAH0883109.1 hypothetical protein HID58_059205 [Brassica napus]CAF1819681.1 unnamed protein product [Brassica napus]CDY27919.1 BnaCnng05040D [Brassica napus]